MKNKTNNFVYNMFDNKNSLNKYKQNIKKQPTSIITEENEEEKQKVYLDKIHKKYLSEIDSISCHNLNDKEYMKKLFKEYDNLMQNYTDEQIISLNQTMDIEFLEKIILFLRFKKVDSYREKIKLIKKIEVDYDTLIIYQKRLEGLSEEVNVHKNKLEEEIQEESNILINDLRKIVFNNIESENINKEKLEELKFLSNCFAHLYIYLNSITLVKCVLFNYHKKTLVSYDEGKPKFKIIKNKSILTINGLLKLVDISSLNTKSAFNLFIHSLKDIKNSSDYSFKNFIYLYEKNNYLEDEYNKLLLDNKYLTDIKNRIDINNVDMYNISNTFFTERKVLLPNSGIILLLEDHSYIESIYLKEKMLRDTNNLIIITRYKDGTECANSIILDLDECLMENIYEVYQNIEQSMTMYILHFFNVLDTTEEEDKKFKYTVISPTYWKYRNNGYISSGDKLNDRGLVVKREFQIEIAPFFRKINSEPSIDAKKLAINLGVKLEKGYTIVKPHTRTYNKINK